MPEDKPAPSAATGPDEPTRRAEFDKWFTENIGKILADDDKLSDKPAPTPAAPPASSGLSLKDVEDFMNRRDQSRASSNEQADLKKGLQALVDRFDAREKAERRRSWFGLPW